MLSYNFDYSNFDHAEVPSEDENDFKVLRAKISRLTIACKDQEKLLQICDDREAKLKEQIISLKIKLPESERDEEGMRKKYKEKEDECEGLKAKVMSLRKQ